MVDNKSDVDSPTPFATGSTSRAETSTAAAGSTGHNTSSHNHGAHAHNDEQQTEISDAEHISGERGEMAPESAQQASDREPAEGGELDDSDVNAIGEVSAVPDEAPEPEQL